MELNKPAARRSSFGLRRQNFYEQTEKETNEDLADKMFWLKPPQESTSPKNRLYTCARNSQPRCLCPSIQHGEKLESFIGRWAQVSICGVNCQVYWASKLFWTKTALKRMLPPGQLKGVRPILSQTSLEKKSDAPTPFSVKICVKVSHLLWWKHTDKSDVRTRKQSSLSQAGDKG